jgi:hypothetical protein
VADALSTLHAAGILHRDVKPSNIMIDAGGRMVLADFGLARTVGAATLTRTGEALGTPLYMSPEQLLGERARIDGRTDVYGLGATLYELLAGRPLFAATEWPELVRAILEERPQPLHEIAPGVPRELSRVVMKALEKRPEDRYATAAGLRDDLLAFAEGRGVTGRPISATRLRLRRLRRRWKQFAIAAAVLLGLGYIYSTWPATLVVHTYPAAEVLVDGRSLGTTPLKTSVRPGSRELLLRSPGFRDDVRELSLKPGGSASVERILIASNPEDPKAVELLAKRYELAMAEFTVAMERTRGGDDDGILPLYPRGDVRLEDLAELRIDIGPEWAGKGTLEVRRRGESGALFSAQFAPDRLSTVAPVPEAAKSLKPGDEFEWGFYPEKGDPVIATCRIRAPPRTLEELDQDLAEQDATLRAILRANCLLKEGLLLAAYLEASRIADEGRQLERSYAVMQRALEGMGLSHSPLWLELIHRIEKAG